VYAFIKAHREQYSVQMMCRVLEVAVSGYYEWLKQPISNHDQEDARLLRLSRASFVASHGDAPLAPVPAKILDQFVGQGPILEMGCGPQRLRRAEVRS